MTTGKLKELAVELVSACRDAVHAAEGENYNILFTHAARAVAKGR
jgi:hypothetical protein